MFFYLSKTPIFIQQMHHLKIIAVIISAATVASQPTPVTRPLSKVVDLLEAAEEIMPSDATLHPVDNNIDVQKVAAGVQHLLPQLMNDIEALGNTAGISLPGMFSECDTVEMAVKKKRKRSVIDDGDLDILTDAAMMAENKTAKVEIDDIKQPQEPSIATEVVVKSLCRGALQCVATVSTLSGLPLVGTIATALGSLL